jgi:2-oxoglutarate ferredoxin oxidoreductase subunit alpha
MASGVEPRLEARAQTPPTASAPLIQRPAQHTVEIVSDSGEGAQKCGQIFGTVSAKMGNGVWTVDIIPAEIQPPPRNAAGASGIRIRIGSGPVTNWGDETDLVVAFNEQALLGRHRLNAIAEGATILLEDMWATHDDERIRAEYASGRKELESGGYRIIGVPMQRECLEVVDDPRKGKNMFALGMLACIYGRDLDRIREEIAYAFRKKSEEVYTKNVALLERGHAWASASLDFRIEVAPLPTDVPMVVMNGNQAIAMGAVASDL